MPVGNSLKNNSVPSRDKEMILRKTQPCDGSQIHALVKNCKPLDLNSVYSYLLLCQHFADTCVVAEIEGHIVAFLSGYIPPSRRNVLFVWQIAVDGKWRGQGLGKRLLNEVLHRNFCRHCCFLETTITPSNDASWNLFRSVARDLNAPCQESICFSEKHFGQKHHEAEYMFRIGPFDANWVK